MRAGVRLGALVAVRLRCRSSCLRRGRKSSGPPRGGLRLSCRAAVFMLCLLSAHFPELWRLPSNCSQINNSREAATRPPSRPTMALLR